MSSFKKKTNSSRQEIANRSSISDSGPKNGETRTRTGDTTIFSRAAPPLKSKRFAGVSSRFGGRGRVQIFSERAAVSRTLRPTGGLVGLFVEASAMPETNERHPLVEDAVGAAD